MNRKAKISAIRLGPLQRRIESISLIAGPRYQPPNFRTLFEYWAAIQFSPELGVAYFRLGQVLTQGRKGKAKGAFHKDKDHDHASEADRAATEPS